MNSRVQFQSAVRCSGVILAGAYMHAGGGAAGFGWLKHRWWVIHLSLPPPSLPPCSLPPLSLPPLPLATSPTPLLHSPPLPPLPLLRLVQHHACLPPVAIPSVKVYGQHASSPLMLSGDGFSVDSTVILPPSPRSLHPTSLTPFPQSPLRMHPCLCPVSHHASTSLPPPPPRHLFDPLPHSPPCLPPFPSTSSSRPPLTTSPTPLPQFPPFILPITGPATRRDSRCQCSTFSEPQYVLLDLPMRVACIPLPHSPPSMLL
ncbi:unnamed protein product [Closterium sp. Naga37s-1]|nr:unnamed protein product [Closterium sp. Naga37s-1]